MINSMKYLWIRNLYYKYIKSNRYPYNEKKRLDDNIRTLKNKYNGKSCVIVGNGPSLTARDLTMIYKKKMISFGANSVYKMFEKTRWRPSYYVFQDQQMIDGLFKYFGYFASECDGIIVRRDAYKQVDENLRKDDKLYFPRLIMHIRKDNYYDFSEEIDKCAYDGCTVTYLMIQMAYYMGFKKIYLIGIDNNFPLEFDENDNIIQTKQDKFHAFEDNKNIILNPGRIIESTYAYKSAYKFLQEHSVEIYNSTRGGKLEVFPRMDFDLAMSNK